jgi:hypothetical protein
MSFLLLHGQLCWKVANITFNFTTSEEMRSVGFYLITQCAFGIFGNVEVFKMTSKKIMASVQPKLSCCYDLFSSLACAVSLFFPRPAVVNSFLVFSLTEAARCALTVCNVILITGYFMDAPALTSSSALSFPGRSKWDGILWNSTSQFLCMPCTRVLISTIVEFGDSGDDIA